MTTATATTFGDLVSWATTIRSVPSAGRLRFALERAITPALASRALSSPPIARRFEEIPEPYRAAAVQGVSAIVRHKHLRHSDRKPFGAAFAGLHGDSAAMLLLNAPAGQQDNAVRVLSNTLGRVSGDEPVNLTEFLELVTLWPQLTLAQRSRFVVDFYAARA